MTSSCDDQDFEHWKSVIDGSVSDGDDPLSPRLLAPTLPFSRQPTSHASSERPALPVLPDFVRNGVNLGECSPWEASVLAYALSFSGRIYLCLAGHGIPSGPQRIDAAIVFACSRSEDESFRPRLPLAQLFDVEVAPKHLVRELGSSKALSGQTVLLLLTNAGRPFRRWFDVPALPF